MTHFTKVDIKRKTSGSKWYTGLGNPAGMGISVDHIHVLPLGFPRLAVMQEGRYWQGGSTSGVGWRLGKEDR